MRIHTQSTDTSNNVVGTSRFKQRGVSNTFDKERYPARFEIPCVGQVIKGLRWMPWDQRPMKDAVRLR